MILEAITATGARYQIDLENAFWRKIDRYGRPHPTERLWDLQVGDSLAFPWDDPDAWRKADGPQIDKHLFISARDIWYTSTTVVEINEIPSWMDNGED